MGLFKLVEFIWINQKLSILVNKSIYPNSELLQLEKLHTNYLSKKKYRSDTKILQEKFSYFWKNEFDFSVLNSIQMYSRWSV